MKESKADKEQVTEPGDVSLGEIAAVVKDRRKAEGMKQVTLAHLAGVTERTIQRLESGQRVDGETLQRVGKVLGLAGESFGSGDATRQAFEKIPAVGRVEIVAGSRKFPERRSRMKSYFEEMTEFDRWANEGLLAWMESRPENPELTRVFAHLIAENIPWLHVMRGEIVPEGVHPEPDWTLAECRANFGPVMDALAAFVGSLDEKEFGNIVRLSSPAGITFEHSLTHVLTNLLGHAEHHRDQIVSVIAKETGEYVPTVYMSYLRCRQ